jgi:pentatricopeptide repeat protein
MEEDGCRPDAITYSTIVKGYCMKGDLDKALEVFRTMQANNMAVDCIIYNTMLDGCTRHNRMDLADIVLADMETYSIKASNFTLGILVKMYGRRKQLDKALEVLEVLPKKHGLTPNAQVSTCLIGACLNCHNVEKAVEVFQALKASGEKADSKAYGALISGLVRHHQVEKAVSVVNEACADCKACKHGEKLIETESLEQLLRALAQKGLMETLGVPMVDRLRVAGMPLSGSSLALFATQKRPARH